jgi:hypothetical protein
MTATGWPRQEERNRSMGLGPIVSNRLIQLSRDPYPSPLRQHMLKCSLPKWLRRIGTDIVNVEIVTDDWSRIPAQYQELSYPCEIQELCGHMLQRYGNSHTAPFKASKGTPEEGRRRKSVRGNGRVTRLCGTTQIAWIFEISERASETNSWER